MLNDIKAAIFDMDGTLIDSMWVWSIVDVDYLAERNFEVPDDLRGNIEHLSLNGTAEYFKSRFGIEDSIEDIINTWNNMALHQYTNAVKLKPGALDLLKHMKNMGIKIALATSNSIFLLETVLKQNNIYDYFDIITTTNEVSRGKDHPDIYLHTAKKLGVNPKDCIVFEDILPAVMGAKAAGMRVVGVYDEYSMHHKLNITEIADKYIVDFNELIETKLVDTKLIDTKLIENKLINTKLTENIK